MIQKGDFVCPGGLSIPYDWVCDQKADCPGGEDEAVGPHTQSQCSPSKVLQEPQSSCPSGMFACGRVSTLTTARCIPEDRVCDGVYDCEDRSDEFTNCAMLLFVGPRMTLI
ncbi:unnamed protein product [Echinostoma caproni]|uniref:Low-density lipoprotein receptor domain class A n=1 Tax=Echinostoma caproni TaxID=27848 RepID=A0A183AFC4_9TREM|nr:unnamed protein product [Echinostoma caproni]